MDLQMSFNQVNDSSFFGSNVKPFKTQLLKWIGNKQRFAHEIINYFPVRFNRYFEPFVGSGAVIGTLSPLNGYASDVIKPLIDIWNETVKNPKKVKTWYRNRYVFSNEVGKKEAYYEIRKRYNENPTPGDFLYLSRACYGGVIRFRKEDGYMSTPSGVHSPITPESFDYRVDIWSERLKKCKFFCEDFEYLFYMARKGDVIYCDPPYITSQQIVYGAQLFSIDRLIKSIEVAKSKGVYVLLSIDGSKKSGQMLCDIDFPDKLFQREVMVNCGRSMLRRFQREGDTLEDEVVSDRLLLTY
ncbi:MAG: Dam family site-specific DNA-(adenine-N6)-methyltransferase [Bdellovibrionales bacterium]|nr:Dam family site-specific DNA-(adenine-N6)-methyltransferase [Bdellovibrionales bacterium]